MSLEDNPVDPNKLLGVVAEVAREARPHVEAYVALDAPGLAETACTAWREADPTAVLDPVELSPKILRACTSAAMPRAVETSVPEPSASPPRSLLRRDGGR